MAEDQSGGNKREGGTGVVVRVVGCAALPLGARGDADQAMKIDVGSFSKRNPCILEFWNGKYHVWLDE